MELITNSMTLAEFESAESLCIKDPATNRVYRVFLKRTLGGAKRYLETIPHKDARPCKYLRVNSRSSNNSDIMPSFY